MNNQVNVVRKTILSCTLNLGVGILFMGVLAGLIALVPMVEEWRAQTWEHVSGIITNGGTKVTPAAYIQWATLLSAVWSLCIALKLCNAHSLWCIPFGLLSVSSVVLGVIPAQYAIMSVCGDWQQTFVSTQPILIRSAVAVATLLPCIGLLLFMICLVWTYCGETPNPAKHRHES
ncbi:putative transmembrane protein [Pseudomonas veronii 1YdBTEX2]|uniref:Putative transmembrane protein n=1 Tax=Pseudomonas veronii 1YdBTEX2 TaxID=1295141 RepID=A0A1D3K8D4_PSEVE|nr:hypothetical protein A7D21_33580 [Pseudomonas sp. AP19]SBW84577.1 putative transmembrane protein [Pseudomonas veronii 1YdBTEX2]